MSTPRIMPFLKMDIGQIKYINVLQKNEKVLALDDPVSKKFIEINNINPNNRVYYDKNSVEVIIALEDLLTEASIDVLLINSSGKINNCVTKDEAYDMLSIYKRINDIDCGVLEAIEDIADTVANKIYEVLKFGEIKIEDLTSIINLELINNNKNEFCSDLLNSILMKDQAFLTLLSDYIRIELITNLKSDNKISICKIGSLIDYKVNRILKYLHKDIDLSKIDDFTIEYNVQGAEYRDCNGTINLFNKSNNKVKKLIDKK